MSDVNESDDRSMSEILSSIRRIVTDEERSRREADDERRRREGESGDSVLVLSESTNKASSPVATPVDTSMTLELGAAHAVSNEQPAPSVDFTDPGLSQDDIEDIVRRIVREELQGPIGQQISRKVKRLIRDEVHAALSEDELT